MSTGMESHTDEQLAENGDKTPSRPIASPALAHSLADLKGQMQFLLYVADQLEEAVGQLDEPSERSQAAFLRKVLAMYSTQLETRHHGLGERIAEICQELYIAIREFES